MGVTRTVPVLAILLAAIFALGIAASASAAKAPPTKPVISSFTASPTSINAGQTTTLRWTVSGATSLSIDQGVGTVFKTSKAVSPKVTTVYTLTAMNGAGSASATTSVTVAVSAPKPTCAISANPSTILAGSTTVLTYSSINATSGTINQGVGAVGVSGNVALSPTTTTMYTAVFTGAGGTGTCATTVTVVPSQPPSNEVRIQAYTTSYSYWDNTPPGSSAIAYPVLHQTAGGTGTYADPITLAVGYSIINGKNILDFPVGARFYIPNVRRYFIVEDLCGDGPTPQNGPCHKGYPSGTSAWVDMWIDSASGTQTQVNACENFLTDTNGAAHLIIQNPASNYVVVPGAVFQNGSCTGEYGNTPVTI